MAAPAHRWSMTIARLSMPCSLALLLAACGAHHRSSTAEDSGPDPVADSGAVVPVEDGGPELPPDAGSDPDPDAGATPSIETCLLAGGTLREVDAVYNNDSSDHGALVAFAASSGGELAAAAADGTIKFWTFDAFVSEVTSSILTYGPELPAAPATDMTYDGARVVAADVGGLVTAWTSSGDMAVLSGTEPGVSIGAVALDATRGRLAHAESRDAGAVVVRTIADGTVAGPIGTAALRVHDLAFLRDGRLLVAGVDAAGVGLVEIHGAAEPAVTDRTIGGFFAPVDEIAVAGDRFVAVAGTALVIASPDSGEHSVVDTGEHAAVPSVDATSEVAFTVGWRGTLRAFAIADGRPLGTIELGDSDPVAVRVDPRGGLVLAAFGTGYIRAIACDAP